MDFGERMEDVLNRGLVGILAEKFKETERCDYRVPVWLTVYLQLEPGDELYF